MKHIRIATIAALGLVGSSACADRMSQVGFSLPAGDAEHGREAFVYLQCHSCHTISGVELPLEPHAPEPPFVELGGSVTRVKTYGQLVTAIINPSHKLAEGYPEEVVSEGGESKMPVYNAVMTVQELIDIVAFLQPQYEIVAPEYSYPMYH
jgi:mono/diheme cytochrome c family protein